MVRQISPESKEPQEVIYKSINLNPWLEEDESVTDTWVYAYSNAPQSYEELDTFDSKYLRIESTDGNVIEERLLQDKWDKVKYRVRSSEPEEDITDDVILKTPTGEEPHKRAHKDSPGKFRIGLDSTNKDNFLTVFEFSTNKGRTELILFGVGRDL